MSNSNSSNEKNHIFTLVDNNPAMKISTTREQIIPGVLILDKIYGKHKGRKQQKYL